MKRITQSKLFNNIWNQFLLYGFSHIIPLVLIPFLLNTIGLEKYGLINFSLAFAFYFQVINEFGFDLSNVRHVVENREDKQELSRILSSIIACKIVFITISFIIYFSIVYLLPDLKRYWPLFTLAFFRLFGIIIAPNWLFRSMEDLRYVTKIVLPIKFICIFPIFIVVKSPEQYTWVMFFFGLESLVSGVISLQVAIKRYGLKFKKVSFHDIQFFIKDSVPFFTSGFLIRICQVSNTVILGFTCGESAVGVYSAAEKLHNAYSSFISPFISHVFYPYFSRIKDFLRINRIVSLLVVSNVVILGIIYLLSPYILNLFIKDEVVQIITYFNLFLLVLAISVPNEALGFPYLGVMGFVGKVNASSIGASLFYIMSVVILFIADMVSIYHLILLLIATNTISLLIRCYYIRKYRKSFKYAEQG